MKSKIIAVSVISLIIGLFLGPFIIFKLVEHPGHLQYLGQLGDFFGGLLNPLIGFFGVIVQILLVFQVQKIFESENAALDRKNKYDARVDALRNFENKLHPLLDNYQLNFTSPMAIVELHNTFDAESNILQSIYPQISSMETFLRMKELFGDIFNIVICDNDIDDDVFNNRYKNLYDKNLLSQLLPKYLKTSFNEFRTQLYGELLKSL